MNVLYECALVRGHTCVGVNLGILCFGDLFRDRLSDANKVLRGDLLELSGSCTST